MRSYFGIYCGAINCSINQKYYPEISLFRFPKDPERSKKWLLNTRRDDLMKKDTQYLYKNIRICALHFEESQFTNTVKKRLVWNAVPTLFNIPPGSYKHKLPNRTTVGVKHQEATPEQQKCTVQGVNTIKQELVEADSIKIPEHGIEPIVVKAETMAETDPVQIPEHEIEHIVVKEENLEWEVPDDHSCMRDPLTIVEEECPPSEDFLTCSTLNIEKTEDEEDEKGEEENINEEETISCGSSSESLLLIGMEDDNITDRSGCLVTNVGLAAGTGHTAQCTTKKQALCGDKNGTGYLIQRCEICKKTFSSKVNLKKHLLLHTRPYSCDFCSKSFTDSGHLKKHFLLHTVEHLYSCDVCSKRFSSNASLKKHPCIGELPYSCVVCQKRFKSSKIVKKHYLTHTGERPYICDVCGKSFISKSYLSVHSRVHTAERPYSCGVCKKTFTQSGTLNRHKMMHTGEC